MVQWSAKKWQWRSANGAGCGDCWKMAWNPEVFSLREDRALEKRLSDQKLGTTCVEKCVKPAPCSQEMSCNLVGHAHAHEQVGGAALVT